MINEKHRENLIIKINSIEDKDVLDEVNRLLEVSFDDTIYVTNSEQRQEISKGRDQIKNGKGIDHKSADAQIDSWLER